MYKLQYANASEMVEVLSELISGGGWRGRAGWWVRTGERDEQPPLHSPAAAGASVDLFALLVLARHPGEQLQPATRRGGGPGRDTGTDARGNVGHRQRRRIRRRGAGHRRPVHQLAPHQRRPAGLRRAEASDPATRHPAPAGLRRGHHPRDRSPKIEGAGIRVPGRHVARERRARARAAEPQEPKPDTDGAGVDLGPGDGRGQQPDDHAPGRNRGAGSGGAVHGARVGYRRQHPLGAEHPHVRQPGSRDLRRPEHPVHRQPCDQTRPTSRTLSPRSSARTSASPCG